MDDLGKPSRMTHSPAKLGSLTSIFVQIPHDAVLPSHNPVHHSRFPLRGLQLSRRHGYLFFHCRPVARCHPPLPPSSRSPGYSAWEAGVHFFGDLFCLRKHFDRTCLFGGGRSVAGSSSHSEVAMQALSIDHRELWASAASSRITVIARGPYQE